MDHPSSVPLPHRHFLDRAVPLLARDPRVVGIAAGGSYAENAMDACSDIDLLLVCEPSEHAALMQHRTTLASQLGPLVAAFTGEHVGEPRLLICLYGPPALHVDIKVVTPADLASRTDDAVVLWDRCASIRRAVSTPKVGSGAPDAQWIEERFWVWVHYGALKIERGELQEALDFLSYLRVSVLGPLGLQRHGLKPYGVRRVENNPELAAQLASTVGGLERAALIAALENAINLYLGLRPDSVQRRQEAQEVALDHVEQMKRRLVH